MAKVILINGSPRENGCTARALDEMIKVFIEEGIETELFQIGKNDIRGCVACNGCQKLGHCVYGSDIVNEIAAKFENADGLVVSSPVYYHCQINALKKVPWSLHGTFLSFILRLKSSKTVVKMVVKC
ncbi:MAG: flavodoxin family protein [Firmicutes bacterium]|nr:flavodoxin family protein [Bacillota bacterium]